MPCVSVVLYDFYLRHFLGALFDPTGLKLCLFQNARSPLVARRKATQTSAPRSEQKTIRGVLSLPVKVVHHRLCGGHFDVTARCFLKKCSVSVESLDISSYVCSQYGTLLFAANMAH